jgi:predicted nucleic acid-binding Zn finger protein
MRLRLAHPQTDQQWLADRGLVVGARVGSCTVRDLAGTVVAVVSLDDLAVRWDDTTETVRWTAVSPFGYLVEVALSAAPTTSRCASAACHLERRADWRTVRIDGTRYVVLTSGNSGRTYILRADAAGCSCPWYQRTGRRCSHMLALELAALEDELAEQAAALSVHRAA